MPGLPIQGAEITMDELQHQGVSVLNVVGSPPLPKPNKTVEGSSYNLAHINTPYVAMAQTVGDQNQGLGSTINILGIAALGIVALASVALIIQGAKKTAKGIKNNWLFLVGYLAALGAGWLLGKGSNQSA